MLESRFPDVPWAQIRGMGNRIRHEYDLINVGVTWETVAEPSDLDDLLRALHEAFPEIGWTRAHEVAGAGGHRLRDRIRRMP
jgi:uncharacterized protein with HEPN domain